MVHQRINEREPNPNPNVNFITALPVGDITAQEAARQLLRALAAQVKPIMKAHGFVVNSLEEYEYNKVFAGRNWNHGETIELVLRSSTGSLLSAPWLMSTFCHELAHIKYMDHGPAFQALWRQVQQEVRAHQDHGYYGDGYWSSGARLADSAKVAGQGIEIGELPEYMCGGAHSGARPVSRRQRILKRTKRRKAGTRVKSDAFNTTGQLLNEGLEGHSKSHGIGFRKKAGSKRAREERALAAERRIQTLQDQVASTSKVPTSPVIEIISDSEDEKQNSETDYDRRRTLLKVVEEKDLDALRATMFDPSRDFLLPCAGTSKMCGDALVTQDSHDSFQRSPSIDSSTRPRKKPRTSQSKLDFISSCGTSTGDSETIKPKREDAWDCMVCTLINEPNHLACSACGTPREP